MKFAIWSFRYVEIVLQHFSCTKNGISNVIFLLESSLTTMSRHMSTSLLKYSRYKFMLDTNFYYRFYLSKYFSNVEASQKFSSAVAIDTLFSKRVPSSSNYTIDDILPNADGNITASQTVYTLKVLRTRSLFGEVDSACFKNDSRFSILCNVFEQKNGSMLPHHLISGLRSLLEIGVSPHSSCVTTAEENIIKNASIFSTFHLIGCLYYHHKFMETSLQNRVVSVLVSALQSQLQKISTPAEILMLPHILHLFGKNFKNELEQKIAKSMLLLSVQEMSKLLCALAEKSNRNVLILNSLSYHLQQKTEKPTLKDTIDMFYAFKKLNFFDPDLFSHLLNHLAVEIPTVEQASLVSGLLTACGHMGWNHKGIIDACGDWIINHLDSCRIKDIASYVLTAATLNYTSPQSNQILKQILPHLTVKNLKSSNLLLDVAWSLAVLDWIPKELLLNVLEPEFYKSLVDSSDSKASITNQLKFLNLKGILKKDYPECVFGCNLFIEPIKLSESGMIENCRRHVLKVLSNFVPKNKLSLNEVIDTGVFIDAEFIMNEKLQPLPLETYGIIAKSTTSTKPLPSGCKRIALLVMFHKDYTHYVQNLTGVNALGTRLLTDAGFTVVKIHYNEFSRNKTELQKAKYLSQQISTVVKYT